MQLGTLESAETVVVTRVDSDLTPSVNKSEEICTRDSLSLPFPEETNYQNNVCVRFFTKS